MPAVSTSLLRSQTENSDQDQADADLLDQVREGDHGALRALVEAYRRPLIAYATRLVGEAEEAEDIVQIAFLRLWERRSRWAPSSSPRRLLYTITRNLAFKERLRRSRGRALCAAEPPRTLKPAGSPTPAECAEVEELRAAMEQAVRSLSPRRRQVLVLSRYHGFSRTDVAELTGLSSQTVANYLVAAIAQMRSMLAPFLEPGT